MSPRLAPFSAVLLVVAALGCQRPAPQTPDRPTQPATAAPAQGSYVAPLTTPVSAAPGMDVASLVERLKPTVVNITTTARATMPQGHPLFDGFNPGRPGGGEPRAQRSLGTGFIVDPAGFAVTNAHVIAGADEIRVRLSDERELPAKVVGKDPKLDLALIKIEGASGLSAAVMGDSDVLRVGDWVIAIGNPFGLGHTVTLGITSAKDRTIGAGPYDAFIQTDASINPGNSGGPLFNLRGEVIGIPTAIRAGAQGIGFAVPVNALKDILPQLRDRGVVTRGKLGVRVQHVTEDLAKSFGLDRARGALVANVEAGSAGARAGLLAGDVIVQVEGQDVVRSEDLPRLIARHAPGKKVRLGFMRAGKSSNTEATLDTLMDETDEDSPPPPGPRTPPQSKLGIQIDDAPNGGGARIRGMAQDSPAVGQLAPGDVIIEIDKQPIRTAEEAAKRMEAASSGQVLLLKVRRGPDQRFVTLKIRLKMGAPPPCPRQGHWAPPDPLRGAAGWLAADGSLREHRLFFDRWHAAT